MAHRMEDATIRTVSSQSIRCGSIFPPAYRAAADEGADMVMSSFQTLNGTPSAANDWLLKDVLRKEWN